MPFFYKGWGWLVPVITFLCLLATEFVAELVVFDKDFYQENIYMIPLGLIISAGMLYLVEAAINNADAKMRRRMTGSRDRIPEEEESAHSMFMIPFGYWPSILIGAAICFWAIRFF